MKQVASWPLFVVALLAIFGGTVNAEPFSGAISGTVKDNEGRPLVGAVVGIYDVGALEEKPTLTKTNKDGHFLAAVLPGNYKLRASAAGYKAEMIAEAKVVPHQTAVFEFKLKPATDLMSPSEVDDSYKYVLRRNRTIFDFDIRDDKPLIAEEKKPFVREIHGLVNFSATKSLSNQPGASSFAGVNFAISQMFDDDLEVVVSGQTGVGRISPQRLDTQASVLAGDDHKLTLSLGYGRLPILNQNNRAGQRGLNQYTIHATDRWHIAGPVVILYGFDYYRFDGASQASRFTPRVNLDLQLTPQDQLFAAIYSPGGADIERSEEFETTQVDFHGPVELIDLAPDLPIDRSQRYEIGYSHTFKNHSRVETALFWDNIGSHTITTLPIETVANNEPGEQLAGQFNSFEQHGHAQGVRVIVTHPISENITASVGYAFGQGQQLDFANGQPNFSIGYFQVFSGKIDAQVVSTGTHISAVVRVASPQALLAIDPFQERLHTIDPNISIYITQAMPMFSFIPGHWEANLDARNLLDRSNGDENMRLALGHYWRTIRGGFSVRF